MAGRPRGEALGVLDQDVAQPVDALEEADFDAVDLFHRLQASARRGARRRHRRRRNPAWRQPPAPPVRSAGQAGRGVRRSLSGPCRTRRNPLWRRPRQTAGRVSMRRARSPSRAGSCGHAYIVCKGEPPRYSPRRFAPASATPRRLETDVHYRSLCAGRRRQRGRYGPDRPVPADRPDLRDHVFPDPAAAAAEGSGSIARWSPISAAATRSSPPAA